MEGMYLIIGLIVRTVVCWLMFDDAKARGMRAGWWGVLGWLSPFIVGLIYLIARKPRVTLKTEK